MKIFNHYIPKSFTFIQIVKDLQETNKKILDTLSKKMIFKIIQMMN